MQKFSIPVLVRIKNQNPGGWMIERKNSELPETCELSDEELEVRKSNIRLMRSLINRFKDKHKDYTEEWRKSELGDIRKNSSIQDQMNLTDEVVLDESNA